MNAIWRFLSASRTAAIIVLCSAPMLANGRFEKDVYATHGAGSNTSPSAAMNAARSIALISSRVKAVMPLSLHRPRVSRQLAMLAVPMFRDVEARCDPYMIELLEMIEEPL